LSNPTAKRTLHIIGGKCRGRKVTFADVTGIRPTPNRVRETLFNWLSPYLQGAHCIEPFAGSGILSLEALSRGVGKTLIIDQSSEVIEHIRSQILNFATDNSEFQLHCGDALDWMQHTEPQDSYNIAFLDPPFSAELTIKTCNLLARKQLLAENAMVYIESEHVIAENTLPENWRIHRSKQAGSVHYCLCIANPAE
jgi:16S rRNA (guanine966-N2)-methyltransferase